MRSRDDMKGPTRTVAVAAARFAATLAAFVCVPLVILSGGAPGTMAALGILAAALPSIVGLSVLTRDNPDGAIGAAATSLFVVSLFALLTGGATIGLAMLAVGGLVEAAIHGSQERRKLVIPALLLSGAIGIGSPFLAGQGGLSPGALNPIVTVSGLVSLVQVTVVLLFAAQRYLVSEKAAGAEKADHADLDACLCEVALLLDRSGRVTASGRSLAAALGLSHAEIVGRGLVDHVHVADRATLLTAVSEAAAGKTLPPMKLRLRCPGPQGQAGGRYVWVAARFLPHAPEAGAERVTVLLRDIDDQEAELAALRAADSLRDAALRNRGLFISSLSHEVRTPLNAVIGFSEMLSNPEMGPLAEETVREYATIIHDSGQQLFRLVTATIDLIRLDSGTYELNPESFDLAGLVDSCIEAVAETAESRNVTTLRRVPPFMPDLVADRRTLKQALEQVLSNAIKFAPEGSAVTVEALGRDAQLVLRVSDTGPGIPEEHLARVCDPFFQGDGSYDRSIAGAGLGLALVKRLVAALGGELRIESRLGVGTRVEIVMPVQAGDTASGPGASAGEPVTREAAASGASNVINAWPARLRSA